MEFGEQKLTQDPREGSLNLRFLHTSLEPGGRVQSVTGPEGTGSRRAPSWVQGTEGGGHGAELGVSGDSCLQAGETYGPSPETLASEGRDSPINAGTEKGGCSLSRQLSQGRPVPSVWSCSPSPAPGPAASLLELLANLVPLSTVPGCTQGVPRDCGLLLQVGAKTGSWEAQSRAAETKAVGGGCYWQFGAGMQGQCSVSCAPSTTGALPRTHVCRVRL